MEVRFVEEFQINLDFCSHFARKMGSLFCKWEKRGLHQDFVFIFVGFLGLSSDFLLKIMVLPQFFQVQLWLVLHMLY